MLYLKIMKFITEGIDLNEILQNLFNVCLHADSIDVSNRAYETMIAILHNHYQKTN